MNSTLLDAAIDFAAKSLHLCRCCIAWPLMRIAESVVVIGAMIEVLALAIGGAKFAEGECAEGHEHGKPTKAADEPPDELHP